MGAVDTAIMERARYLRRSEALAIISDPSLGTDEWLVETAWCFITGMSRHPGERWQRRTRVNLGAAVASPEWPMSAVVISSGAASWGVNDA